MKSFNSYPLYATTVAEYTNYGCTLRCCKDESYYYVVWHNGRQTARTFYTTNKDEANTFVLKLVREEGYRRIRR